MTPTTPSPISDQAAGEPVLWWNGFRKDDDERDGLNGPAFSPVETTWHDIPLYAGINPCNLSTAPTTGSAPEPVLRCACGNIAEPRDSHVDALRCKSCWDRFAAPAIPEASQK